ncbi:MAG: hypothetical protein FJ121_11110 [Deltaproteobacteria bacterium]|nr:hypothetical protein [Deltaproteobacteria bacterium]
MLKVISEAKLRSDKVPRQISEARNDNLFLSETLADFAVKKTTLGIKNDDPLNNFVDPFNNFVDNGKCLMLISLLNDGS